MCHSSGCSGYLRRVLSVHICSFFPSHLYMVQLAAFNIAHNCKYKITMGSSSENKTYRTVVIAKWNNNKGDGSNAAAPLLMLMLLLLDDAAKRTKMVAKRMMHNTLVISMLCDSRGEQILAAHTDSWIIAGYFIIYTYWMRISRAFQSAYAAVAKHDVCMCAPARTWLLIVLVFSLLPIFYLLSIYRIHSSSFIFLRPYNVPLTYVCWSTLADSMRCTHG